jgi:flagella basal body P-ring formation protein FlgA
MHVALATLLLAFATVSGQAGAAAEAQLVATSDPRALQEALAALAARSLEPQGYFIDAERTWLTVSRPLPATGTLQVRPLWSAAEGRAPQLPLSFELRPVAAAGAAAVIKATLAVTLLREVQVAMHRTRKGSAVTCADFHAERRALREVSAAAVGGACDIAGQSVALRELASGDVLNRSDVGPPLAVVAGSPVQLSVASGAVSVTALATALADARIGDELDVRLQHPIRTLKARVVAPGAAALVTGEL